MMLRDQRPNKIFIFEFQDFDLGKNENRHDIYSKISVMKIVSIMTFLTTLNKQKKKLCGTQKPNFKHQLSLMLNIKKDVSSVNIQKFLPKYVVSVA